MGEAISKNVYVWLLPTSLIALHPHSPHQSHPHSSFLFFLSSFVLVFLISLQKVPVFPVLSLTIDNMRFSLPTALLVAATLVSAHPERLTKESAKRELVGRGTDRCASQIEARRAALMEKRSASLNKRQIANGKIPQRRGENAIGKRESLHYTSIQNDTCLLAPDTIFGPYAVDEEVFRHDVREGKEGVDMYLDIGVIDVETCEP